MRAMRHYLWKAVLVVVPPLCPLGIFDISSELQLQMVVFSQVPEEHKIAFKV